MIGVKLPGGIRVRATIFFEGCGGNLQREEKQREGENLGKK